MKDMNKAALNTIALAGLMLPGWAVAHPQGDHPEIIPAGYTVTTIPPPIGADGRELQFGIGAIGFSADGTAFVASRVEGVWTLKDGVWRQFATGLHDPQGIRVSADGGTVYVCQKPELTLLRDLDLDGSADLYHNFCDQWLFAGNYCEYVHGIATDRRGNMFLTINLADGGGSDNTPGLTNTERAVSMGTTGGFDGWVVRVDPDGVMTPWAYGLRSPAGIGISRDDEVFYTDNQGGWVPTSPLYFVEPGAFYGYPSSMADLPDFASGKRELATVSDEDLVRRSHLPVVWMPHGELMNSPGNPEWDYSEGSFGPFQGQIFIGCQARSNIVRVALDRVRGHYQGAVFNFIDYLHCGVIRLAFDAQGRLWAGETGRGWASRGGQLYGLQRIEWDGRTTPFEMLDMKLTDRGFAVRFTQPVDPESITDDTFAFTTWHYHYHQQYGSPKVDQKRLASRLERVSADRKTVWFEVPLQTGKVYHLLCTGLISASGAAMSNRNAYYTLNYLRESADMKEGEEERMRAAVSTLTSAPAGQRRRVLAFSRTDGYRHSAISYATRAFELMAARSGSVELVVSEDIGAFEPDRLVHFDAVILNNVVGDVFRPANFAELPPGSQAGMLEYEALLQQSLADFVASGKGLLALHGSAAAFPGWAEFGQILGARFDNHPWPAGSNVTIRREDPDSPLTRSFSAAPFSFRDEIYQFRDFEREQLHVLLSLVPEQSDITKPSIQELIHRQDGDFPLSWWKPYGKGRVFYSALGHQHEVFQDSAVLDHWFAGLQFVSGDLSAGN